MGLTGIINESYYARRAALAGNSFAVCLVFAVVSTDAFVCYCKSIIGGQ